MSTAGWNALETGQSRKYSAKKSLTAQFQEMDASKEVFGQTSTLTSMMTSNIFWHLRS